MRTLILGSKGQLGRDLQRIFSAAGFVAGLDLPELDITDESAIEAALEHAGPDLVLNAAAYTDVEAAEAHFEEALRVNALGPRVIGRVCAKHGLPVVHYSTDYVFPERDAGAWSEDDPVDPDAALNAYGRSKALGEIALQEETDRFYIIRTAWLFGPGGNNFVEKILRAAATRPALKVVDDETGCPTHTWDLADATLKLVGTGRFGIYHIVNRGECSRYAYAREILRLSGINIPVTPCSSSEYPTAAKRARRSVLSTARYETVTGERTRLWQDALAHYLERRLSVL
ncbi:MAG TPA: dTDP-4-dehydrorhamnose reductase [Candidatus Hydrogenedentes bacterium]|nr:dTDP-4-dehydrorhamnose reductase [Candidatus Hydrogenedentota bacterium]HPU96789.1 dTDP-4-dehydrorhamnose reductase [Candidatus Hydrogenedentota bacterium]